MKKLFLILLLTALFQPSLKAQCLDTIGINPPEIQMNFLMLSGWGVNEKPGGLFWAERLSVRHKVTRSKRFFIVSFF